jgi:hypothetical protein
VCDGVGAAVTVGVAVRAADGEAESEVDGGTDGDADDEADDRADDVAEEGPRALGFESSLFMPLIASVPAATAATAATLPRAMAPPVHSLRRRARTALRSASACQSGSGREDTKGGRGGANPGRPRDGAR